MKSIIAKAFHTLQAASSAPQANLGDRAPGQTYMGFMENHQMVMYFTPAGKQGAMLPEETMLMLYVCSKVLLSKPHAPYTK